MIDLLHRPKAYPPQQRVDRIVTVATAPRLQAILNGIQPTSLTLAGLMKRDIPIGWDDQRPAFDFL